MKYRIDQKKNHEKRSFNNISAGDPATGASGGDGDVTPVPLGPVDRNRCPSRNSVAAGLVIFPQVVTQVVILPNCLTRDIFN